MPRYSPRTGALQEYQVGPYDSRHFYVQWGGKLPGGETWSCGFRMLDPGGHDAEDTNDLLVGVSAALAAFHVNASSQIRNDVLFSFVKVNSIELDGTYTSDETAEATYADLPGTGGATPVHPNQIAIAVGLDTGFTRGPAHTGRFYLPLPTMNVQPDGRVAAGSITALKGTLATLRTAVNAVKPGNIMVVMSRKAGAPGHRAVVGFKIGRTLDTQRRRRKNLVEAYA